MQGGFISRINPEKDKYGRKVIYEKDQRELGKSNARCQSKMEL
jgi:hypothetical protein